MKRCYPLFCALLLVVLGACSEPSPPADSPGATGDTGQQVEATAGADQAAEEAGDQLPDIAPVGGERRQLQVYPFETWTGDLDEMKKRRVIRVLTVYSVGRYYLEDGQPKGLVRESAIRLEQFINRGNKKKNVKTYVAIIPVARDQLLPALLAGRGDLVIASLSITPERQKLVDFTIPVSKPISEILVTGPSAPGIESMDDLAGQTLYVRHSSSYRESLDRLNQTFEQAGKALIHIEPVTELLEDEDLIEMVNAGLLPWAIVDDYRTKLWEGVMPNLRVRRDIVFREGGHIAWAFRKNSPRLEKTLNQFLKKNREGTLTGNVLKDRYITSFDWAANALARDEYGLFKELEETFRKYGKTYEVDYLLAAAQGFQESRLRQSARSRAGAIGVMQLLPSTANDPNVAIKDIHLVDNNIHAGIKYLNFLRSRYFSDPEIDPLNQTFLALAAYNTGPRNMINLRNKAKKLGYDPNVWFDNVELVAARDIGPEPVQYVANIYKYYLAYRYSVQQMARREAARKRAGLD
jgi:membrane-bound lytic murein transglycosylase MltF